MATPGQLVEAFSEALGLPESMVRAHDRVLSEAGLRTKTGRGASAARMSSEDASWLLISLMSGCMAKDAAVYAKKFADLINIYHAHTLSEGPREQVFLSYKVPFSSGNLELELVDQLRHGHSLYEMLDALLFASQSGRLEEAVSGRKARTDPFGMVPQSGWGLGVRLSGPNRKAEVRISCDGEATTAFYAKGVGEAPPATDWTHSVTISHRAILFIGSTLRGGPK